MASQHETDLIVTLQEVVRWLQEINGNLKALNEKFVDYFQTLEEPYPPHVAKESKKEREIKWGL